MYHNYVFSVRNHGFVSGSTAWNGIFNSADDPVCTRYGGNQNCVDFYDFSIAQSIGSAVYLISGILVYYDRYAGDLLLVCT